MALPQYLSWTGHGSSCGEPPGVFTGGTMHLFGLAADVKVMQALADRFLHPVAGLKVSYIALGGQSLLTMVNIEKGTTTAEAVGWLPGRECALWIPLLEATLPTLTHPIPPPPRIVMWSPYIFISYAIGMATGREVWGWSKALANITFPGSGAMAPEFTVSTVVFRELDATKPGGEEMLIKITGNAPLSTASSWLSIDAAAIEILEQLTIVQPSTSLLGALHDFPAIALKQFRDSSVPNLACYQAIVNSPVRIKNFGGGGFHAASFEVKIETCASHPIVKNLLGGTPTSPSTTVPVKWAAWVKFDFDALPGSVIATTT